KIAELLCSLHPKKSQDFLELLEKTKQNYEFLGFNPSRLTPSGYFNYTYLPTMSIIGLRYYFETITPKTSIFTKKEIQNYRSNKGITVNKLLKHLSQTHQDLMTFLDSQLTNLIFRSVSSPLIKLPLKPSTDLERLARFLIPTDIGATLYNATDEMFQLRKQFFNLSSTDEVIVNQLLGKFLRTFGFYNEFHITSYPYLHKWQDKIR
ncbi:MAG: hypothetical protein JXA54_13395, partial [Candidatus Heimdallarchaeota archaeon]|nr:hypothetical protein [Candidatus Heimdallarchaeota archaeon]